MNRRTFNVASLAALLSPMPRLSLASITAQTAPGHQVAEIKNGQFTASHGGMATSRTAVNDNTLFQVASCSKTVTALAVLTLVRDGRVELDQPASTYLRRWRLQGPRGETATVADLLSHTAGTTVHGFAGYGPDEELPSTLEILSGHPPANSDPIRTRQRLFRRFSYSGGGTMVLQSLIEDVTGIGFASYAGAEVLEPVGADHATFAITPNAGFAHGTHEDGKPLPGGFRRHPESAAAGLWATASDLARVMDAIVQSLRGTPDAIIPKALARRMVTPVSGQSALGVFVHSDSTIFHDGRNFGFDATMAAELDTGRIRAAVTNRNGALEGLLHTLPD
ncbi:serine hydrolase [uncultured Tateyamaria sp.]|uniref:serine hydrolase domain-containing protein n=1 Tax=uncultured Tateyamaria sp. TaxID=455651 RepID=UPI0026020FB7|nr:serine hydrolase domain-containing protein [uncultured Tateyamaria sp.]